VVIVTDDDLANLEIAMDVREMAPEVPIVMRLYDQRLANKVKQTIDVQVSVSTSKLAAPLLASAALDEAVVGTHRVGSTLLVVMELLVHGSGTFAGKTVEELGREGNLTVVAVQRAGQPWTLQPASGEVVRAGDRMQVMVPGRRVAEMHARNGKR
jgi:Trk K+ transport system NAD-binding subunit